MSHIVIRTINKPDPNVFCTCTEGEASAELRLINDMGRGSSRLICRLCLACMDNLVYEVKRWQERQPVPAL